MRRWVSLGVMLVAVAGWFFLLRPQVLGGPAGYIVVNGSSMEPNLHTGDLVVVTKKPGYRVGDIVAYPVPEGQAGAGSLVIHRIVGGSPAHGYLTRGDNAEGSGTDLWRPKPREVIGKLWFRLPLVAQVLSFARTPLGMATVLSLLSMFVVLGRDWSAPATPRSRTGP